MRKVAWVALLGGACLGLAACGGGGGEAAKNESGDLLPGQSVNAPDGVNASGDASGTTGSSTGDAGGPLNIAGDAQNDAAEANAAGSNSAE